jgi:hypothetical protein
LLADSTGEFGLADFYDWREQGRDGRVARHPARKRSKTRMKGFTLTDALAIKDFG